MRDDQIVKLVKQESEHLDNVSMLRSQQARLQTEAILTALCEPMNLIKGFFIPFYFRERVEEIYKLKAQDFNERLNEVITKQKLKI